MKTKNKKAHCAYKSGPLAIAPTVYRPGYNISYNPISGGNLKVQVVADKNQLVVAYGYDSDIQSDLDSGTFMSYQIDHKNTKLPDYEFHGYIIKGDFSLDEAQQKIRVTSYDGVALEGHAVVPQIILRDDSVWDDQTKTFYNNQVASLWKTFYPFLAPPKQITYQTNLTDVQLLAKAMTLYQQVAKTKFSTKQFDKAFDQLKDFFKRYDFREIDKKNEDKGYLLLLKDYAYWLQKTGNEKQAVLVNQELLKRNPDEAVNYLILAKSQLAIDEYADEERAYYQKAAKDNLRQYCVRVLKANNTFNPETEQLIKTQLGVKTLSQNSCMPIMDMINAVKKGDIDSVKRTLEQGVGINSLSNTGRPALFYAIYNHDKAMISFLLDHGADVKMIIKDPDNNSNGDQGIFSIAFQDLINQSYDKSKDIDFSIADLLLARGADIDCLYVNDTWPLLYSVAYGDIRIVRYLLEKGADPNKKKVSKVPLLAAINAWRYDSANLLIEYGADVNAATYFSLGLAPPNKEGFYYGYPWQTPLIALLTVEKPHPSKEVIELFKLLLAKGANPALGGVSVHSDKPDCNGWEALVKLAYKIQSNEIGCLLEQHKPEGKEIPNPPLCIQQ